MTRVPYANLQLKNGDYIKWQRNLRDIFSTETNDLGIKYKLTQDLALDRIAEFFYKRCVGPLEEYIPESRKEDKVADLFFKHNFAASCIPTKEQFKKAYVETKKGKWGFEKTIKIFKAFHEKRRRISRKPGNNEKGIKKLNEQIYRDLVPGKYEQLNIW